MVLFPNPWHLFEAEETYPILLSHIFIMQKMKQPWQSMGIRVISRCADEDKENLNYCPFLLMLITQYPEVDFPTMNS